MRGTAVEGSGGAPVAGVVMLLLDTDGHVRARALTNERGEYRLAATAAGTYRVRTLRIGYRSLLSGPFELAAGAEVQHRLELASIPVSLDTIRVAARGRCGTLTDSAGTVAAVWEQARTALTAAQITATVRTIKAVITRYHRGTDPSTNRVLSETVTTDTNWVSKPWRSRTADSLRRFGYTHEDADGWRTYHAPDLDVLLSGEFLEDHCFRLAMGAQPQSIGIAFEPTRDRSKTAEIEGTLWLDRISAELQSLQFRYVNTGARGIDQAGGGMEFARMSNGAWVITSWNIRMPLIEERRVVNAEIPGGALPRIELRLREWRFAGGDLSLVTRGSDTLWSKPTAVVAMLPKPAVVSDSTPRPEASARDTAVLAKVEVRAGRPLLTEFEERSSGKSGHFLTRAQLAKEDSRSLPDVLTRLPGLRVVHDAGHAWVTNGRGVVTNLKGKPLQRACYVDVWLDGFLVYGGKPDELLFDVGMYRPNVMEGVEFYSSSATAPIKYSRPGASCGVLLLWTRKP